jgi:hypothetical protein
MCVSPVVLAPESDRLHGYRIVGGYHGGSLAGITPYIPVELYLYNMEYTGISHR